MFGEGTGSRSHSRPARAPAAITGSCSAGKKINTTAAMRPIVIRLAPTHECRPIAHSAWVTMATTTSPKDESHAGASPGSDPARLDAMANAERVIKIAPGAVKAIQAINAPA